MVDLGSSPGNIQITQSFAGPSTRRRASMCDSVRGGSSFPETAKLEVLWDGQVIGTIDPSGPGDLTSYNYIVTASGTPPTN